MNAIWARFNAVLYHQDLTGYAEQFWAIFGDGISSRHAAFCIERFPFMESISSFHHLNTSPTYDYYERIPLQQWRHSDNDAKNEIKTWIAKWAKSEHLDYKPPLAQDVFLYPKGMCSINTISRVLVPSSKESNASEVVIIGSVMFPTSIKNAHRTETNSL
jgi:cystathionine gamma-synthase